MTEIADLVEANRAYMSGHVGVENAKPARRLAIVTCMDVRIDVLPALGLKLGDAHVLRNAGGRVTVDVLRSLAVSSHVLGVDTVVVMQHTRCGMAGVANDELQTRTGSDLDFLTIDDHHTSVRDDIGKLSTTDYLGEIKRLVGFVYDVTTGGIDEVVRWER